MSQSVVAFGAFSIAAETCRKIRCHTEGQCILTPDNFLKQGMQNAAHVSNNMSAPALPAPTAVLGNVGTVQGPSSGNATSSSHVKSSNSAVKPGENKASVTVEATADSSKKDQASSKLSIHTHTFRDTKNMTDSTSSLCIF